MDYWYLKPVLLSRILYPVAIDEPQEFSYPLYPEVIVKEKTI